MMTENERQMEEHGEVLDYNTVYIVGNYPEYGSMFKANQWVVVDMLEDADVVQFCGGADVTPKLYNEEAHWTTNTNPKRDTYEADIFKWCFENNVPMAGICRGAQFLHVMSGGSLWQNVDKHAITGTHSAFVLNAENRPRSDSNYVEVTSTHHQMMRISAKGEVLVTAGTRAVFKETMREGSVNLHDVDLEAIYHEETNCLCYQPHPEYVDSGHECQRLYFTLLDRYLFEEGDGDV